MNVTALDARMFVGIPYAPKGRSLEGLDCYGLAVLWYRRVLGKPIKDYVNYDNPEDSKDAGKAVVENMPGFVECAKEKNAIVLFRVAGVKSHVGIVLDDNNFLHVLRGRHVTLDRLDGIEWAHRIVGYYKPAVH